MHPFQQLQSQPQQSQSPQQQSQSQQQSQPLQQLQSRFLLFMLIINKIIHKTTKATKTTIANFKLNVPHF